MNNETNQTISLINDLRLLSTAVIAAGLLAACSTDDASVSPAPDSTEVTGDAVVFTISTGRETTRAFTTDNYWTINDSMAICEGATVYKYKANEGSSASGGRVSLRPAVAENTYFWSPEVTSRTFKAWYPWSLTAPSAVTVETDQSTMEANAYYNQDILYAPDLTVGFKQPVDLSFYHQMCRIMVTVNTSATKGQKPVTDIKLGNDNIAVSGTLTPGASASWVLGSQNSTVTMRKQSEDTTDHLYTYECIVPPQSLTATAVLFQITTTAANSNTTTTNFVPQNMFIDAPVFSAGYQYNYSITLSASGMVNISTVQVDDWSTEYITGETATIPDAGY